MIRYLLILFVTALLAGCTAGPWGRNAAHESIQAQQQEAIVHDPYTNENIAPEVVGGRPREYQKDFAQPQRDTLLEKDWLTPPIPH